MLKSKLNFGQNDFIDLGGNPALFYCVHAITDLIFSAS